MFFCFQTRLQKKCSVFVCFSMFVKRLRSSPFFSFENGTDKLWKSSCVTAALGPCGVRGELRRLRRLRPAGRTPRGDENETTFFDENEVFSEVTIKYKHGKN